MADPKITHSTAIAISPWSRALAARSRSNARRPSWKAPLIVIFGFGPRGSICPSIDWPARTSLLE